MTPCLMFYHPKEHITITITTSTITATNLTLQTTTEELRVNLSTELMVKNDFKERKTN